MSGYCHLVPFCCCLMLFRKASAVQSAVWTCQSGSFHLSLCDFLGLNCHTWNHWVKRPRKWLRRVVEPIRAAPHLPAVGTGPPGKGHFLSFHNPTHACCVRALVWGPGRRRAQTGTELVSSRGCRLFPRTNTAPHPSSAFLRPLIILKTKSGLWATCSGLVPHGRWTRSKPGAVCGLWLVPCPC